MQDVTSACSRDPRESRADAENLVFQGGPELTLGVEIEVQLVDWKTKDLCPAAPRLLRQVPSSGQAIAPEIFQSMLELRTGICDSLAAVRRDLEAARRATLSAAASLGVEVLAAGTHPFASNAERLLYPSARYRTLIDRNQWIARRLTIFGLHVHVGMRDGDHAIAVMNGLLPHLAMLLALSSSSPFYDGQDTGLASARSTVSESQPTAGTPPTFADWEAFAAFYRCLLRSRAILSPKDLWWDLRPSPKYGTLEVRICDFPSNLEDVLAIVALVRCLAAEATDRLAAGEPPPQPALWRLRENKWRAARWGMDADLVTDDAGTARPLRAVIGEKIDQLLSTARRLGCEAELLGVERIGFGGTSSERQRAVFAQSRSTRTVVESLVDEWGGEASGA